MMINPMAIAAMRQLADNQKMTFRDHHEPSLWLRNAVLGILGDLASGRTHPCAHVAAGLGFACLWRPNLVGCGQCFGAQARPQGEENFRCDRCGIVSQPLQTCMVSSGKLLIMFGLCNACHSREASL